MITLAIPIKHICINPALMRSAWNLEVGSLWECDECGREKMLVERGYRVGWRVLDAQYFGVPQRRKRIFIVGTLGENGRSPEEILAIKQSRAGYFAKSKQAREDLASNLATGA